MFESFDAILLSRIQFAFTVSFHFIFPSLTIGLASYLAFLEGLWLKTADSTYLRLFHYWLKIFALTFVMGVVSGLVMSYQFGTNWGVFSYKTGPVLGPLMGYEVYSAFFLEAGFLGIMLFGINRIGRKMHFFATLMVAFGTFFSAFWILSVNSWMHTPAGHVINELGQFVPENWMEVIFNPSFPYRFMHTIGAAFLTTTFVVGAVGAYHLLRHSKSLQAQKMFSMAMWMAIFLTPVQLVLGDMQGRNTLEYQPAKIAAIEGRFDSERGAPLILIGIPDGEKETVEYAIKIPLLASLILTHNLDGKLAGLKSWPRDEWPNLLVPFFGFRIMVSMGLLMLALAVSAAVMRYKGRLFSSRPLLRWAVTMGGSGFIAVLAGWFTTETGRQPYTVYHLLRTVDSVSPIAGTAVGISLFMFAAVYLLIFGFGIYYLFKLMGSSPEAVESPYMEQR